MENQESVQKLMDYIGLHGEAGSDDDTDDPSPIYVTDIVCGACSQEYTKEHEEAYTDSLDVEWAAALVEQGWRVNELGAICPRCGLAHVTPQEVDTPEAAVADLADDDNDE